MWICPLNDLSARTGMASFYSSIERLLHHFLKRATDIEDSVDWVFLKMIQS